ncbi:Methyltransferase-like protein 21A, partial [Linnemannia zychae]
MAPNNSDPSTSLPLGPNESTLPLECSILQEPDINEDDDSYYGSVLPCIGISHLLVIESRGLQSASWFDGAFDSRSGPGIYKSGNGGLEFRVTLKDGEHAHRQIATTATATTITSSSSQDVFWIRIGSPRLGIVPLALGPYAFPSHRTWLQQRSRPRSQSPRSSNIDTIKVIRPFDIPSPYTSAPPRTLVLTEWHNHMPQGRVWDSAFIMLDIFRDKVSEGIRCLSAPLLAGKRILDLSTGSGLIGLYLAGLAEVEERNTRIPTTMTTITTMQQQTKVVMTDLSEAMELIHYNINNNSMIAPQVNISAQTLQWGESLDSPDFKNLDIVIASDVIYNIKAFESLLNTLIGLCVPGRTIIYLGYKRRHLSRGKETEIFAKIRSHFNVEETVHELG